MYLEKLRSQNPLTICITNDVVKNFTANGLLALGASPAMSEYPEDLEDLLPYAKGLLINTGTLTNETWELYKSALDIAEKYGVPTVLDPVAAGAGAYRKKVALDLLHHHTISLVRGNAGEIAALIGESIKTKGVDSAQIDNVGELALRANQQLGIPVVITGKKDAVAVNHQVRILENGSELMPLVTGTGCYWEQFWLPLFTWLMRIHYWIVWKRSYRLIRSQEKWQSRKPHYQEPSRLSL